VLSITSFTQGSSSIPLCNSQTQATCNGLSYTVTAGKAANATDFLNTTIAGTSTNRTGFAQTIDVSAYTTRPFTLYYTVKAYAGDTSLANVASTSSNVVLLGYPLSASTASPPVNASYVTTINSNVTIVCTGADNTLFSGVTNIYSNGVYNIVGVYSASRKVSVTVYDAYDKTGSTISGFGLVYSGGGRVQVSSGSSIYMYMNRTTSGSFQLAITPVLLADLPTGGTISTYGALRVHTFTSNGTFTIPSGYYPTAGSSYTIWIIGGGGGGGPFGAGSYLGGGGGAGEVLRFIRYTTLDSWLKGPVTITIGNGGTVGNNGGNTTVTCTTTGDRVGPLIALGGGAGGQGDLADSGGGKRGNDGGCGGGGGMSSVEDGGGGGGNATSSTALYILPTDSSLDSYHFYGGQGGSGELGAGPYYGGGGGGAGGFGQNGVTSGGNGQGGLGKVINGTTYATGGSGTQIGGPVANTGNGGHSVNSGASGIVIISYYP
jgi:hypothetical protein